MSRRHTLAVVPLGIVILVHALESSAQQSKPNTWSLSLSLRETRGLDVLRNGEAQPDEIVDAATAGFGFAALRPRSSVNVFGRIGGNRRQDLANDTQLTYGGHFVWTYQNSERSTMSLSSSVNKNFRLDTLTALGALPGDLTTLNTNTQWSLQHRAGPRTNWNVGVIHQYYDLSTANGVPSSQIVLDEQPFGSEFEVLEPQPLPGSTADAPVLPDGEADILRILATEGLASGGTVGQRGGLSFGIGHQLTDRTSVSASVQGSYQTIQRGGDTTGPRGGAELSISRAIRASQMLNASYSFQRSVVNQPGITVHSASAGWTYSHAASRVTVQLSAGASQFRAEGSSGDIFPVADASLGWAATESTQLGISYRREFSIPFGFGRSVLIDYGSVNLSQTIGRLNLSVFAGTTISEDPTGVATEWEARRAGVNAAVQIAGPLSASFSFSYVESDALNTVVADALERRMLSMSLNYSPTW